MANEQGCGYGLADQLEGQGYLPSFELRVTCSDHPDEVTTLVQATGVHYNPRFKPRYDSRYIGWTQFIVEGLSTGERAILLVEPRYAGGALIADLRLAVPGSPAGTVMPLTCAVN